jgi:hypothetical protein
LWDLAGLTDSAPVAEKGYSMLTAAGKKRAAEIQKAEAGRRKKEMRKIAR